MIFLSTTNYFPYSLKKCGEMLGLLKKKVEFEHVTRSKLYEYCERDTEIVTKLVQTYFSFITLHDLGKFSYTRPAQAMAAFRHCFMDHRIYIHNEEKAQKLERECYFGGRCEMWEQGVIKNGPFISYDINGMYPFVMRDHFYPTRLRYFKEKIDIGELSMALQNFCVCAHCLIKTDIALYPVRGKSKTIFPVGEFEAYLTTPEIQTALKHGHLQKVYSCAFYDRDKIFTDYVEFFHDLRIDYKEAKNEIMEQNCKIFHNSLYGKFGEMIPETDTWDTDDMTLKREKIVIVGKQGTFNMYQIMGKVIIEKEKHPGRRTFTAVAAHVTAHARTRLNDIIQCIGFNRVLYCDTDSIKGRLSDFNDINYPISNTELGALKNEGVVDNFELYGLKDYVWGDKKVIKGVKKGSEMITENEYFGERFMKPKTLMKYGIQDYVMIVEAPKVLSRQYNKGVILDNKTIRPYNLPEEANLIF